METSLISKSDLMQLDGELAVYDQVVSEALSVLLNSIESKQNWHLKARPLSRCQVHDSFPLQSKFPRLFGGKINQNSFVQKVNTAFAFVGV